jgi:hypothetical protein
MVCSLQRGAGNWKGYLNQHQRFFRSSCTTLIYMVKRWRTFLHGIVNREFAAKLRRQDLVNRSPAVERVRMDVVRHDCFVRFDSLLESVCEMQHD